MQKKVVRNIMLTILTVIVMLYGAMYISTNGVIEEARMYFYGQKIDNTNLLYRYSNPLVVRALQDGGHVSIELSIRRLFVLHNFYHGYIWINYTFEAKNDAGDLCVGSWSIPAKWEIERVGHAWRVVHIEEAA